MIFFEKILSLPLKDPRQGMNNYGQSNDRREEKKELYWKQQQGSAAQF